MSGGLWIGENTVSAALDVLGDLLPAMADHQQVRTPVELVKISNRMATIVLPGGSAGN